MENLFREIFKFQDGKNDGKMLHLGPIFKVPNLKCLKVI